MLSKIKNFVEANSDELFLIVVFLLIGLVSFGLGRMSVKEAPQGELIIESMPVEIKEVLTALNKDDALAPGQGSGAETFIVGNKNSKIYHRSDCSGAVRMSESNKIYFASIADAVAAGYRPAGNCPGLE